MVRWPPFGRHKCFSDDILEIFFAQNLKISALNNKYASHSGGLCHPDPLAGLCPWIPLGDFRPPDPFLPPFTDSKYATAVF